MPIARNEGDDILFDAVKNGMNAADIKKLLKDNPNLSLTKQNVFGLTPLYYAVIFGNEEALEYFLSIMTPAQLNIRNYTGSTILHVAATQPNIKIFQTLFANSHIRKLVNEKAYYGFTPLDLAIRQKNEPLAEFILSNQPKTFGTRVKKFFNSIGRFFTRKPAHSSAADLIQNYVPGPDISQAVINKRLREYLISIGNPDRIVDLIDPKGNCFGWTFLYQFYAEQNKSDVFFKLLEWLTIPRDPKTLLSTAGLPKAVIDLDPLLQKSNATVGDFLKILCNNLAVFQKTTLESLTAGSGANNSEPDKYTHDREKVYQFMQDKEKGGTLRSLFKFTTTHKKDLMIDNKIAMADIITMLSQWRGTWVDLIIQQKGAAFSHAVTIKINENGELSYYDPNLPTKVMNFTDPAALVSFIRQMSIAGTLGQDPNDIEIRYHVYKFYKKGEAVPEQEHASHPIAPPDDPKGLHINPLNWLIMANDVKGIKKLLHLYPGVKDNLFDFVNFYPDAELSPFELAMKLKAQDCFVAMLEHDNIGQKKPYSNHGRVIDFRHVSQIDLDFLADLMLKGIIDKQSWSHSQHHTIFDLLPFENITEHAMVNVLAMQLQANKGMNYIETPLDEEFVTLLIQAVLQRKLDINFRSLNEKNTPLILAVRLGSTELLEELLKIPNINVNLADNQGMTPLMWAAKNGWKGGMERLLKAHADPNLKNKAGKTALDLTPVKKPKLKEKVEPAKPMHIDPAKTIHPLQPRKPLQFIDKNPVKPTQPQPTSNSDPSKILTAFRKEIENIDPRLMTGVLNKSALNQVKNYLQSHPTSNELTLKGVIDTVSKVAPQVKNPTLSKTLQTFMDENKVRIGAGYKKNK